MLKDEKYLTLYKIAFPLIFNTSAYKPEFLFLLRNFVKTISLDY